MALANPPGSLRGAATLAVCSAALGAAVAPALLRLLLRGRGAEAGDEEGRAAEAPRAEKAHVSKLKQRNEAWLQAEVRVASCEAGYRRLLRRLVRRGDSVLELGCHEGVTTVLARSLCDGVVVGIDASDFSIGKAKQKYCGEKVNWALGDATDVSLVGQE
eukprot:TRINITY_DN10970_c0_g1_i3.p2 TRINITY_DN10970_c0_g1~~TRINITY_DN10970_c0_g1_i3.p2  ORF type:complete len:179 (+),score=50.33 TRINITY_DN10970_c0_g1_i3:60-539(+)